MLDVAGSPRDAVVKAAIDIQERHGLTGAEFAQQIGMSESAWNRVRRGERQPGVRMLQGIRRAFPETTELVMRVLFAA
jgi:transcriptional regulator with XRE-family HTH domain